MSAKSSVVQTGFNFFKSGDKATSKGVKATEKASKNVTQTSKEVKNVKNTKEVKNTKNVKSTKNTKAEKAKGLMKDKKAFLKYLVKKELADWLFNSDPKENTSDESADDALNQTSSTLKRKQSKERSDKGTSHWRKDGDIEKASKYRYTVDLDKAIEQDKQLKNINERLDSALYAIAGNVPNFKASKTSQTSQKVSEKDPASDESVKSLAKSITTLNDNLRKQKQPVTEETAQSLLASNAKIEALLTKISADMIDEQDTKIKPVVHSSEVEEEEEDPQKSFLASVKNLTKKAADTSLFKSMLTMLLMGLTGSLIHFIADNFIDENGNFTFDKILPQMEEWFSEKWEGLKTWFSETFSLDKIINSIKEWFTSDPVAALGEGFVGALAGLAGVKVTSQMMSALKTSNQAKMSEASDTVSKKKLSEAKTGGGKPKKALGWVSKLKGLKSLKAAKFIPGVGIAFAVIDVISAISNFISGDTDAAITDLIDVAIDIVECVPGLGTLVAALDIGSSFTDQSLAERLKNLGKDDEPEEPKTVRDELDKAEVIKKSGWWLGSKDEIKDKEQLELMSADYIKELIDTGDWSDEDLKYLKDLYDKKINTKEDENSPEFKQRKKQVIEKIKDIGKKYHEDEQSLIALCKSDEKYAKVIEQANKSNDKLGYVKQVREVLPNLGDIYERMQLALKTAYNLGHSVKLTDDEINKLLGIGQYDKTYLDENQEVVKSSEVGSDAFNESVEKVMEAEKAHDNDGDDYEKEIRNEMMKNPEFFHTAGGPRSEFDNSGKPSDTGVKAEDYNGSYTTVGGDAIQINDSVGGPYAQKYPNIRGIRNNNPGNLRIANVAWEGKIPREKNTDGSFEQFCAPEFGIRALVKNALNYQNKYNLWTPRAMIWKWAPPNENNSDKYVTDVVNMFHSSSYPKAKEIGADTSFSMTDPELAYCMTCGIITKECGIQPYPDNVIKRAINAALGKESLTLDTQANVTVDASASYTSSLSPAGQTAVFEAGPEGKSKNFSITQSSANMPNLGSGITAKYLQQAVTNAQNAKYSQENRQGDGYYDCSSFVSRTLKQCGFNVNPLNTTRTLRKDLTANGFTYHSANIQGDYSMLQPGDILLNDTGNGGRHNHTEIYMGDGWSVGAHSSKNGVSPRPGVIDYYCYNGFLRPNGGDITLEDGSTLDTSWANPVKNTDQSDAEIAQTSEGIANASSTAEQAQTINVSNNVTNAQQPEEETNVSSNNMFDASVVDADMSALEFAM